MCSGAADVRTHSSVGDVGRSEESSSEMKRESSMAMASSFDSVESRVWLMRFLRSVFCKSNAQMYAFDLLLVCVQLSMIFYATRTSWF